MNVNTPPEISTAAQNDLEGHETELNSSGIGDWIEDHEVPLNVNILPIASTAAQNETDGQDIDEKLLFWSMSLGADHEVPLNVNTFPVESGATQNVIVAQETDTSSLPESKFLGADHEVPLKIKTFGSGVPTRLLKSASPTATQKVDEVHETDPSGTFGSINIGALQDVGIDGG